MKKCLSARTTKGGRPRCLAILLAIWSLLLVGIAQAGADDAEQGPESVSGTRVEAPGSPLSLREPGFSAFQRVPGTVLRPLHEGLPLRESAPGFLGLYGRALDKTRGGDLYLLTEGRLMQHFFRNSVWVKIVPVPTSDDGEPQESKAYWAYWGSADRDVEPNFVAVGSGELNDMNEDVKAWVSNLQDQLLHQF